MESPLHFLVVDDVPMLRQTAAALLRGLGYTRISEAEDGEQALALLRATSASSMPVDFVVTDWNMPGMNGIVLLRAVRLSPDLRHLAVLMVSANGSAGDRAAAIRAGVDGYLFKPVTSDALRAAIECILAKRGWQTTSPPACMENPDS